MDETQQSLSVSTLVCYIVPSDDLYLPAVVSTSLHNRQLKIVVRFSIRPRDSVTIEIDDSDQDDDDDTENDSKSDASNSSKCGGENHTNTDGACDDKNDTNYSRICGDENNTEDNDKSGHKNDINYGDVCGNDGGKSGDKTDNYEDRMYDIDSKIVNSSNNNNNNDDDDDDESSDNSHDDTATMDSNPNKDDQLQESATVPIDCTIGFYIESFTKMGPDALSNCISTDTLLDIDDDCQQHQADNLHKENRSRSTNRNNESSSSSDTSRSRSRERRITSQSDNSDSNVDSNTDSNDNSALVSAAVNDVNTSTACKNTASVSVSKQPKTRRRRKTKPYVLSHEKPRRKYRQASGESPAQNSALDVC